MGFLTTLAVVRCSSESLMKMGRNFGLMSVRNYRGWVSLLKYLTVTRTSSCSQSYCTLSILRSLLGLALLRCSLCLILMLSNLGLDWNFGREIWKCVGTMWHEVRAAGCLFNSHWYANLSSSTSSSVGHLCYMLLHQSLHQTVHIWKLALWSRVNQTSTDGFCGFAT